MTEPLVIDAEGLATLNDQHWRRLGITQTFDRLLVEAAATRPGQPADIRGAVAESLSGGAAKFWDLSFTSLTKDLTRRGVLASGERVQLAAEFGERLNRLLTDLAEGTSHVDPTPGVTLEAVLDKAKKREEAAKAAKAQRPRTRAASPRAKAEPKESAATPRKRSTEMSTSTTPDAKPTAAAAAAPAARPAPRAAAPRTPSSKLFTSLKLNRLLDSLDNAQLLRVQLGERLKLTGRDLARFLHVTNATEITRVTGEMVELHWKGRELARTASIDRRMVLIDLVPELRSRDEDADEA